MSGRALAGRRLDHAVEEASDPPQREQPGAPAEREPGAQQRDGRRGDDDGVGPGAQPACPGDAAIDNDDQSAAAGEASRELAPLRFRLRNEPCAPFENFRERAHDPSSFFASLRSSSSVAERNFGRRTISSRSTRQAAMPPAAKTPVSTPIASRRLVSQNSITRKNTSRTTARPRQNAATAASTAILASRALPSSISLATISRRVCSSATKVFARFRSESRRPSARPASSVMGCRYL